MNSRILSLSATGNTLLKASVADTMSGRVELIQVSVLFGLGFLPTNFDNLNLVNGITNTSVTECY